MTITPQRKLVKAAQAASDLFAAISVALSANPELYDTLEIEYNEAAKIADSLDALVKAAQS